MEHNVIYTTPYDSEVEYLESTGTQWIDTLCPITLDTVFKVKFISLPNNADNTIVAAYASADSDYSNYSLIMRIQRYLRRDISYNSFGNSGNITPSTDPVEITLASSYYQLNNETPQTFTPTIQTLPSFQVGTSLFAIHSTPSRVTNYAKIKLYYFQQYDNNTLIRDFIPVRVGQIGFMYDKVSGKLFGNKGTGNFILGPDVANPIPNIRRVFRFDNKQFVMPMPYDSKVEYLESPSGNAYINTLIATNKISEFTVRVAPVRVPSTFYALGADNGGDTGFSIGYSSVNAGYVQIRLGEYYNGIRYTLEQFDTITLNRLTGKYYVNGTEYTGKIVTNSKTNPNSFILFRARTSGTTLNSNRDTTRIASFSAKGLNGELVLDLIPVRRGNIGYMYDKISGKLFGNSGTGQFILGNDIND